MEKITHSREGVTVAIDYENSRARALTVEVPGIAYMLAGRYVETVNGVEMWDHAGPGGTGRAAFSLVYESIPTTYENTMTGQHGTILYIVAEVLNIRGEVTQPNEGLRTRLQHLSILLKDLYEDFGPGILSDALHMSAADYGYSLQPDAELIEELGQCPAYHERKAAIYDRIMANPTIDGIFAAFGINPADLMRDEKDEP